MAEIFTLAAASIEGPAKFDTNHSRAVIFGIGGAALAAALIAKLIMVHGVGGSLAVSSRFGRAPGENRRFAEAGAIASLRKWLKVGPVASLRPPRSGCANLTCVPQNSSRLNGM